MSQRFFHGDLTEDEFELTADEAHHLRVSRVAVGDVVTVFDGRGLEARCRVVALERRRARLRVEQRCPVNRELRGTVWLFVPAPQGDRQRWLVEKATELGVHTLQLIVTRYADRHSRAVRIERFRRWVIEASKQCGRNRLMAVREPIAWSEACAAPAPATTARFVCHPEGRPLQELVREMAYDEAWLAVGPEGGWADEELTAALAAGWWPASLGPTTLRTETAALAAVTLVRTRLI